MGQRWLICALGLICLQQHVVMAQDAAPPAEPQASPKPEEAFEAREFKGADGGVLRYRLLKPLDYDPGKKYPLVLFLHGAGERGSENSRQLINGGRVWASDGWRRRHPAFVVAPQCPEETSWTSVILGSRSDPRPSPLAHALDAVDALQQEFSIDADRLYCVGLSMGGEGVWEVLRYKPKLLAAAVPICGTGSPAFAADFAATPIWIFHGEKDGVVPADDSRQMAAALAAAGGRPIYTEYPGVDHDAWTRTFENRLMWDWLFAQREE